MRRARTEERIVRSWGEEEGGGRERENLKTSFESLDQAMPEASISGLLIYMSQKHKPKINSPFFLKPVKVWFFFYT